MALIKCIECGNDVSEMAVVCPHCGNPIGQKPKEKVANKIIVSLVGSALIAVAPLLPYMNCVLHLPGSTKAYSYNMWKLLSPEDVGANFGESAGFFGLVPTLILILGAVGVILAIVQIVKKKEFKVFVQALIPISATVLFVLYEAIGYRTLRSTEDEFLTKLGDLMGGFSSSDLLSRERGIGFYLIIAGIVVSMVALFIKSGKKAGKKTEKKANKRASGITNTDKPQTIRIHF